MAKRNKKATRKIERLRDRLHHADENPDFKVGWVTQYMFVMDNFDIGETKRANENRWLYTIGPQRRTRYPFETLVIPGTHYTLHWFMQCKITDPSRVPEFRYVPISTGATTLPFGTAPYVPTVQISQTKSDWVVVPQDDFIVDAKLILQCLAKCINQHNFTIFDARDLMHTLSVKHPLISHEETICELEFLERQKKGIVISYQNRYKRKSEVKLENPMSKKPRMHDVDVSSVTRSLIDMVATGPMTVFQAAQKLQVKEKLIHQIIDVLLVVGHISFSSGLIYQSSSFSPNSFSPKSPSSCDDSYGPIPETPPQSMPLWDCPKPEEPEILMTSRHYATRSATKAQGVQATVKHQPRDSFLSSPISCPSPTSHYMYHSPSPTSASNPNSYTSTTSSTTNSLSNMNSNMNSYMDSYTDLNSNTGSSTGSNAGSNTGSNVGSNTGPNTHLGMGNTTANMNQSSQDLQSERHQHRLLTLPHIISSIPQIPPIMQMPVPSYSTRSSPPPTQPAPRLARLSSDPVWNFPTPPSSTDTHHGFSQYKDYVQTKGASSSCDMTFDAPLDLSDSSIVDFFQSSFWDAY